MCESLSKDWVILTVYQVVAAKAVRGIAEVDLHGGKACWGRCGLGTQGLGVRGELLGPPKGLPPL